MSTQTAILPAQPAESDFQTGQVLTIAGGHFVHDSFTAFVAPLLPLIIARLSLSLTSAGALTVFLRLPSLANPMLGYAADRISLRYFIILAPTLTAAMMSALGLAPSYGILVLLLLAAGVSSACFHVPAPAMMARISGRQLGRGMSVFMAAGELGRTVGPILAVAAVSWWGLEGMWRLLPVGIVTSLVLWWRLHDLPPRPRSQATAVGKPVWPLASRLFPALGAILLPKAFLVAALTAFLPLYMVQQGASLWMAGGALSIMQVAGVAGALAGGTISDRLGRRWVLLIALALGPLLTLAFLKTQGWLLILLLPAVGLTVLAPEPVMLAVVQENFPENRALANGTYMTLSFLVSAVATLLVGLAGDRLGLSAAFTGGALLAFLSAPAVWLLPATRAS